MAFQTLTCQVMHVMPRKANAMGRPSPWIASQMRDRFATPHRPGDIPTRLMQRGGRPLGLASR